MTEYNEIKNLRKRLAALEKVVKENSSAPRLSYSAIHNGGISEYDEAGNLVSRVGTQHDGTHGAVDIFGPIPPVPTDPTLEAEAVSLTITWDGHVIDELGGPRPLPLDFQCVQILASQTNNPPVAEDLRGVITSEAGGSKSLTVGNGTWYVSLRTRAKSGRMSEPSATVSIVVPSAVDVGQIEADIAQAQADAAAAELAAGTALTAANGKNTNTFGTSAPTGATPGRPGDIFWVMSGSTVVGQYRNTAGTGTTSGNVWEAQTLTDAVIANLDAAKITTGILEAARIGAKSISTEKLLIGSTDNLVDDPNFATFGTANAVWSVLPSLVLNGTSPGRAHTPDTAVLDIVGDIDISARVAATDWTPAANQTLVSKWAAAGTRSFNFQVTTTGALRLVWSADGTASITATSTVSAGVVDGEARYARATLDVDNGASGNTVTFYTSTDGIVWTQLGAPVITAGVTSIFSGSALVNIGSNTNGTLDRFIGRVFSAQIRNGINGTVVANPDFRLAAAGATSLVDSAGRTWTISSPATIATSGTTALDAVGGRAGGTSLKVTLNGTERSVTSPLQWKSAGPESYYRISMWVYSDVALAAGAITSCVEQRSSSGVITELSTVELDSATIPASTWTFVSSGVLGITANDTVAIRPLIRLSSSAGSSGNVWIDQATVARAAAGNLVVDGSITTSKLAAESITGDVIAGGTITGDKFAGEIILGSKILTSDEGQRVEMDQAGVRLYNADDSVRVNLPAADGETASFQGEVQANNLTVTDGMTIYSTNNEISRSASVTLAENLAGPVAGPTATVMWTGVPLDREVHSSTLGNFSLNPSEILGVGRDFSSGGQRILVMQGRPNGTRIWYYTMDGLVDNLSDREGYKITGAYKTDALGLVWFGQKEANGLWYFNRAGTWVRHPATDDYTVAMSSDATSYSSGWYVVEKLGSPVRAYRMREMNISGSEATVIDNVNTPDNSPDPYTPGLAFFWRGNADFGANRWVVGHRGTDPYRVFSSGGALQADEGWNSPASKVGAFWDTATGRFYTLCDDGILYAHTTLTWTGTTLSTWHVGQSFADTNATGGTHETALGTITSFTMKKRAGVRFTLVDVPFAGGVDDPNGWKLYGKRGTAPASDYSDMYQQSSGTYLQKTIIQTTAPFTSGSTALQVGTFPGSIPAIFQSGRALPSDSTKPIIQLKGDGSGRFGTLEVSNLGVVTNTDDTGWVSVTAASGFNTSDVKIRRVGNWVEVRGEATRTGGANWPGSPATTTATNISAAVAAAFRPSSIVRDFNPAGTTIGNRAFRVTMGTDGVISGVPDTDPTSASVFIHLVYFLG